MARKSTLGALVNYYNDARMIEHQWNSGQFSHYDQICIFDGPYGYTKGLDFGSSQGALPLSETAIGKEILADPRVTYEFRVWEEEGEKRIAAYEAMTTDLIALHDTDEFLEFDHERFEQFVASDKAVSAFYCQNLCLDGVQFAAPFYAVDVVERLPYKNFLFKRDAISAADHLDYLWLVSVSQKAANQDVIFISPVATGYHYTAMRSRAGQTQKFIFYGALHRHSSGNEDPVIGRLRDAVTNNSVTPDEALTIYLSGLSGFWGVPHPDPETIIKRRIQAGPVLERSMAQLAPEINAPVTGPVKLLSGYNYCLYLSRDEDEWKISAKNADIYFSSFDYLYDQPIGAEVRHGAFAGQTTFAPIREANAHGRLYLLHVRHPTLEIVEAVIGPGV